MRNHQAEFTAFFQASWEPCLRAVVAVVGSPQLAEDQVAEAFTKAWMSWRTVSHHPAPRAWVVRTALNTGASWWRRRGRELPLADHDVAAPGGLASGLDATLLTAIWRLPRRQREVIALRIFLDLDTDSLARIPMPGAPDTAAIITTGRARRRRRMTGLSVAGTAAVTAVALGLSVAFGATSHQPAGATGHRPTHPGHAQLTAWTVTKLADGNISVRINQFKDPAGLQSTLRADGVPASVTFASQRNPACRPYPAGAPAPGSVPPLPLRPSALLKQVFPQPYQQLGPPPGTGRANMVKAGPPAPPPSGNRTVVVIDPSALPRPAGVQLATNDAATGLRLPAVVYASPRCTGS